jgi:mannonate dehydratase
MIATEFLPARPHPLWHYCRQMGITRAIIKAAPELTGMNPPWDIGSLQRIQRDLKEAGLEVHGLEGDQFDMSRIKLGLDGRDEDIALYQKMLRNLGELGIGLLCYNFMPAIGWFRTDTSAAGRGGALCSGFDLAEVPAGVTDAGELAASRIWENYAYFIRAVMPVAEEAGVRMALHPDDPPLPELRGVGRLFWNPGAFDRAYALAPGPSNAITFCRANFKLMGVDLGHWIRRFGDRIAFLHLRDVRGTAERFEEVFHDEAADDLIRTLRDCHAAGFRGPWRCDHVPTFHGEDNSNPGYGTLGRLFADGYVLGLLDGLGIPRS